MNSRTHHPGSARTHSVIAFYEDQDTDAIHVVERPVGSHEPRGHVYLPSADLAGIPADRTVAILWRQPSGALLAVTRTPTHGLGLDPSLHVEPDLLSAIRAIAEPGTRVRLQLLDGVEQDALLRLRGLDDVVRQEALLVAGEHGCSSRG